MVVVVWFGFGLFCFLFLSPGLHSIPVSPYHNCHFMDGATEIYSTKPQICIFQWAFSSTMCTFIQLFAVSWVAIHTSRRSQSQHKVIQLHSWDAFYLVLNLVKRSCNLSSKTQQNNYMIENQRLVTPQAFPLYCFQRHDFSFYILLT